MVQWYTTIHIMLDQPTLIQNFVDQATQRKWSIPVELMTIRRWENGASFKIGGRESLQKMIGVLYFFPTHEMTKEYR